MPRPKVNSAAQKEIDKAEKNFETFSEEIKKHGSRDINDVPLEESAPQTELSRKEIRNAQEIYLKPKRKIFPAADPKTGKPQEFNEKFRKDYEDKREYVRFIAENKEIVGETITLWTKPFPGIPAEEWEIPVNKPVNAPKYVYDNVKRCRYTRLMMDESPTNVEGGMTYYGRLIAKQKVERLSASKADEEITISMGTCNF